MVRITIDKETQNKLFSHSGPMIELCDESGKLLDRLLPGDDNPLAGWVPTHPLPTPEELKRAAEYDGPGITTNELIARLRAKQ